MDSAPKMKVENGAVEGKWKGEGRGWETGEQGRRWEF